MIDGISGGGMPPMGMPSMGNQNVQLSEDQISQVEDIISNYSSGELSDDDKKSLMDELKSAGIPPSSEVRTMLSDAGIEMGKPPQGPPPGGGGGMGPQKPDFIQEAIEKYESDGLTEDEIADLISQLKDMGEPTQGILVDETT